MTLPLNACLGLTLSVRIWNGCARKLYASKPKFVSFEFIWWLMQIVYAIYIPEMGPCAISIVTLTHLVFGVYRKLNHLLKCRWKEGFRCFFFSIPFFRCSQKSVLVFLPAVFACARIFVPYSVFFFRLSHSLFCTVREPDQKLTTIIHVTLKSNKRYSATFHFLRANK